MSIFCPILMKLGENDLTQEVNIFNKFHGNRTKNVDFLPLANF